MVGELIWVHHFIDKGPRPCPVGHIEGWMGDGWGMFVHLCQKSISPHFSMFSMFKNKVRFSQKYFFFSRTEKKVLMTSVWGSIRNITAASKSTFCCFLQHIFSSFFYLNMKISKSFYDSLTCNGENGTPATDTERLAGLTQDCIPLIACPAPSEKIEHFTATYHITTSLPLPWQSKASLLTVFCMFVMTEAPKRPKTMLQEEAWKRRRENSWVRGRTGVFLWKRARQAKFYSPIPGQPAPQCQCQGCHSRFMFV